MQRGAAGTLSSTRPPNEKISILNKVNNRTRGTKASKHTIHSSEEIIHNGETTVPITTNYSKTNPTITISNNIKNHDNNDNVTVPVYNGAAYIKETEIVEKCLKNGNNEEIGIVAVDNTLTQEGKYELQQNEIENSPSINQELHERQGSESVGNMKSLSLSDRIRSLEQMLLHMAVLNRELELELIETRKELIACKQASQSNLQQSHIHQVNDITRNGNNERKVVASRYYQNGSAPLHLQHETRRLSFPQSKPLPPQQQQNRKKQQQQRRYQQQQQQELLEKENADNEFRGWESLRAAGVISEEEEEKEEEDEEEEEIPLVIPNDTNTPERFLTTREPCCRQQIPYRNNGLNSNHNYKSFNPKQHPVMGELKKKKSLNSHHRENSSTRRSNQLRSQSQPSREGPDAKEVLDLLEMLKRSLMYRCNNSHHHRQHLNNNNGHDDNINYKRPSTGMRRSARSAPPQQHSQTDSQNIIHQQLQPVIPSTSPRRKLNIGTSGPRVRTNSAKERIRTEIPIVSSDRPMKSGRNPTTTITSSSSSPATAKVPVVSNQSARVKSNKKCPVPTNTNINTKVTSRVSSSSPARKVTQATKKREAEGASGNGELEALQRRYWEQSREILEQLDHMLSED